MYGFVFFYVFKMAVAIAFLCENAVKVFFVSFIFYDFELKWLL